MLYREGDAWRALLSLHSNVLSTAQHLSAVVAEATSLNVSESNNATEYRELGYYAALSQVAAQCDALHCEIIKLRGLRKARSTIDVHAIHALLDAHANETLAIGTSLASNVSLSIQSATSDVRMANQETRAQLSQVRALLQLVQEAPALSGRLKICISPSDGGASTEWSPGEVFEAIYKNSSELNEDALAFAMNNLSASEPSASELSDAAPVAPPPVRTVPRRTGDRTPTSHR